MNDRTGLWAGLAGVGLVVACCGGPLLLGAIGAVSASVLLGWATHALFPALGLLVALATLVLYLRSRRTHATVGCRDDRRGTPARNLG